MGKILIVMIGTPNIQYVIAGAALWLLFSIFPRRHIALTRENLNSQTDFSMWKSVTFHKLPHLWTGYHNCRRETITSDINVVKITGRAASITSDTGRITRQAVVLFTVKHHLPVVVISQGSPFGVRQMASWSSSLTPLARCQHRLDPSLHSSPS